MGSSLRFSAAAIGLFAIMGLPGTSSALTISIGGRQSSVDPDEPGIHVTAALAKEGKLEPFDLPCLTKVKARPECGKIDKEQEKKDKAEYRRVERKVAKLIRKAAKRGTPIRLFAYSHGAVAALRVLHKLSEEKVSLKNLTLITVDFESLKYPFKPYISEVPSGVGSAFNFHQFGRAALKGNVKNENVKKLIKREKREGKELDPNHQPFQEKPHSFIQNSFAVRRLILEKSGIRDYLPGIWAAALDATVTLQNGETRPARGPIGEFILDYGAITGPEFTAWRWVADEDRYQRITGLVQGSNIEGAFTFIPETGVKACGEAGFERDTKGLFSGTTTFCKATMTIAGTTPLFDADGCVTGDVASLDGEMFWRVVEKCTDDSTPEGQLDLPGQWVATEIEGAIDANGNPLPIDGSVSTWTFNENGTYRWFLHAPPFFELDGTGRYSLDGKFLTVTGKVADTLFSLTAGSTDVIPLTVGAGRFRFQDEEGAHWSYAKGD